jgi:hypothetical protein
VGPACNIHAAVEASQRVLVRADKAVDEGTPATLALRRGEISGVQPEGRLAR